MRLCGGEGRVFLRVDEGVVTTTGLASRKMPDCSIVVVACVGGMEKLRQGSEDRVRVLACLDRS
jgi:hypothetical protein